MRRLSLILFVLAMGYVAYAGFALRELITGVMTGNVDAISAHVDFPSVRTSLKEQFTSYLIAKAGAVAGNDNDPGAQIGATIIAAVGPAVIGNVIDSLATPSGIATLLSTRTDVTEIKRDGFNIGSFLRRLSIVSPTRFRLTDNEGSEIVLDFEDWTWKVTHMRVLPRVFDNVTP